ncbi:hypothetical protein JCM10908_002022 [Rhodotorula pacifica]|uniref:phosphatase PAP2 family protein n=1 Tax=Rhodotorula pacifica TaxID=1495444 RepID=UPI00317A0676
MPTSSRSTASNGSSSSKVSVSKELKDVNVNADDLIAVGVGDEEIYRAAMPTWRFKLRQIVMQRLAGEMGSLVRIQTHWRTTFRDQYFVKTSLAGTHTFFMLFLPLWYWFGYPHVGKGLVILLASGAYITSVLKDALSVPRPYSPPVERLSVGTHHLEYGFPSTHSSNACSMALFFGSLVVQNWTGHWAVTAAAVGFAALFAWSITFGRLYTGMHSISDVVAGSAVGSFLWLTYHLWSSKMDALIMNSRWTGTLVTVPSLLLLVTVHPEPVEECPCFEDAVAFLSVVAGILLREAWTPAGFATATFGREWRTLTEVGMWCAAVVAKLLVGISTILVWRIIAKRVCHLILPPLFRFFSPLLQLPRRGYKPATEYDSYSPHLSLSPVPSILDLPSLVEDSAVSPSTDAEAVASSASDTSSSSSIKSLRSRSAKKPSGGTGASNQVQVQAQTKKQRIEQLRATETGGTASSPHHHGNDSSSNLSAEHKDADVLTKVVAYVGIGWLASVGIPWGFEQLGLSVHVV